jgi:hypothetical protein
MNKQQTYDPTTDIAYSMCYEKLMYKFFYRIDKLVSFALLLSAMTLVSESMNHLLAGFVIAILTCYQFVFTPAQKGQAAKSQYQAYELLYQNRMGLSDEELCSKFQDICKFDTDPIGFLSHPARLSSLAMQGFNNASIVKPERAMTFGERFAAKFAGEYPEYDFGDKP